MKWVDLSPYKPVSGAAVASTPIANGLQKVQDSLNSVGVAGAAIASAGTINITNPVHQITGVTAIATISDANVPTVGETVTLWIQTGLTIQNNGGGVGNIRTLSGSDRVCKANEIVVLLYDGAVWRETNPQAAGAPYRKTTSKDVANTVTETDLLNGEITVAAGVMGASGVLRLTAWGDAELNGNSNAPQFKLKLGATTLIDTGSLVWQALGTNRTGWKLVAEIMNLGATNVQRVNFLLVGAADYAGNGVVNNARLGGFVTGDGAYQLWGNVTTGSKGAQYLAQGGNAGAVDTTAAQVLAFTVINPAALVTYDVKLIGALVEVI